MTRFSKWYSGNKSTTDGGIESCPSGMGRPATVASKAATVLGNGETYAQKIDKQDQSTKLVTQHGNHTFVDHDGGLPSLAFNTK